jgi:O-antigen ligase
MAAALDSRGWLFGFSIVCVAALAGLGAGADPPVALAATLGLGFTFIAFQSLTAGVVIYTSIIFMQTGVLGGALIASVVILLVAWVAKVATARPGQIRTLIGDQPLTAGLLGFLLGWAALSVTWAAFPSESVVDLVRYALNVSVFFITYTAVQNRTQAAWVMGGYIVAAAFISIIGPIFRPEFLTTASDVAGTDEANRFVGGLADPNELAAVLLPAIAMAIGAVGALRHSPALRLTAGLAAALCIGSFLLTASRGGLVGLGVGVLATVFLAGRWRAIAVVGIGAVLVSIVVYFLAFAPPNIRERVIEPTQGEGRAQESRFTLWQVGWRMFEDNPVKGVGVGNFAKSSVQYVLRPGSTQRSDAVFEGLVAHNTYLQALAELGVIGGVAFFGLVLASIGATLRAIRLFVAMKDTAMELMARSLAIGQIAMLGAIFFFSAQSVNKVWLILALGPALLAVARGERAAAGERELAGLVPLAAAQRP